MTSRHNHRSKERLMRRVFIGSSSEYLAEARNIKDILDRVDGVTGVLWKEVFEPGYLTFEALEHMLLTCDAAVFIASPDDETIRGSGRHAKHTKGRRTTTRTPRANVMLEFGLVAGRMGRANIAICHYNGADLPSDLTGLTLIEMRRNAHARYSGQYKRGRRKNAHTGQASVSRRGLRKESDNTLGEYLLRSWASRLLPTADCIARTDIVHGYSGLWDFQFDLDRWRQVEVNPPSYVHGEGQIMMHIDASGANGRGLLAGKLTFAFYKTGTDSKGGTRTRGRSAVDSSRPPEPALVGELRFCHDVQTVHCDVAGGVRFTSRTIAQQITSKGPVGELKSLRYAQQPRPFFWELQALEEPRTLRGTIDSRQSGLQDPRKRSQSNQDAAPYTRGEVHLTKA